MSDDCDFRVSAEYMQSVCRISLRCLQSVFNTLCLDSFILCTQHEPLPSEECYIVCLITVFSECLQNTYRMSAEYHQDVCRVCERVPAELPAQIASSVRGL